jgi:hypothetical protein
MASKPKPDAAVASAVIPANQSELVANPDGLTWALGFTVKIGAHLFTVEPTDFSEISRGTFEIKLGDDETRVIGSLKKFYGDIDDFLEDKLPDPDWEEFKGPLGDLVNADLTLQAFHLRVLEKAVTRVHVDVTVATKLKVPGIKLDVESLRFQVTYEPQLKTPSAS